MIELGFPDQPYYGRPYSVVHAQFADPADPVRSIVWPTLLDSGSPLSWIPVELMHSLKLRPLLGPSGLDTPFGATTAFCFVEVTVGSFSRPMLFSVLPKNALDTFREKPEFKHDRLQVYAGLGTDAFRDLLVLFDERLRRAFLAPRDSHSARQALLDLD